MEKYMHKPLSKMLIILIPFGGLFLEVTLGVDM